MNFKVIGLLLVAAIGYGGFYFYKKNNSTVEKPVPSYSYQQEEKPSTYIKLEEEKKNSCDCSTSHNCEIEAPKAIKASYQSSIIVPPSSEFIPTKEKQKSKKKTTKANQKRLNRKQAFVPKNSIKVTPEKVKATFVASKTVKNDAKASVNTTNNIERRNRKSAFPYINVIICTSSKSKKYHEKICRGMKRCGASIDKMKAFEAERKGFEFCKICFKHLK